MTAFAQLSPAEQTERLQRVALKALPLWPLDVVRVEPIKVRENAVFAVHLRDGKRVALRVHRLGYHSDEALHSELHWCRALADDQIAVPVALLSRSGRPFECVECEGVAGPRQVDVFEWIDGEQLGTTEKGIAGNDIAIAQTYRTIGELAARMHNQSSLWNRPTGFIRHAWDLEGLVGEQPRWGRFWELEALSASQRDLFARVRAHVRRDLLAYGALDDRYGLIHADLVPENVLIGADGLRIIDFDDAGFGWHMFELATTLYFIRREPYYEIARDAVVAGYRQHRPLSDDQLQQLPMFLAVRGTTYLGWVHTRKGEATAAELTPALMELAMGAADDYLSEAPAR